MKTLLATLMAGLVALPAMAQVVGSPGPDAPAAADAAVAHHDRAVARRAARHHHYRKAAVAAHAADNAAADASVAPR